MKKVKYLIGLVTLITLLPNCSARRFNINSDPSNAKVFYQTRTKKVFKGYTPIVVKDSIKNIGPSSQLTLEKEGYEPKAINIGGFDGTDISLHVTLDPQQKKEEVKPDVKTFTSEEVEQKEEPIAAAQTTEVPVVTPPEVSQPFSSSDVAAPTVDGVPLPEKAMVTPEIQATGPAETTTPPQPEVVTPVVPVPDETKKQQDDFKALQEKLSEMEKKLSDNMEQQPVTATTAPITSDTQGITNTNQAVKHVINAQRFVQQRKINEALVETYKALQNDPNLAFAHALQGSIFFLKRDFEAAKTAWEKALELDPSNEEVSNILNRLKKGSY